MGPTLTTGSLTPGAVQSFQEENKLSSCHDWSEKVMATVGS